MAGDPQRTRPGWGARAVVVAVALALPLLGLALLLANPTWDRLWQHHPAHFWIVLVAAALSALTAYGTGAAANRRGDARVLLVSLAFLSAAAFLGLHALATPGVLLTAPNAGFNVSTPVGLAVGSLLAAASAANIDGERSVAALRAARRTRVVLVLVLIAWGVASLLRLPPFDSGPGPERAHGWMLAMALVSVALYAVAAAVYLRIWRRRRGALPLAMAAAFLLLGEAMVAITFAPNWHLTWWEWHLLMLAAFVLVAWGAQREWHEERYGDLYLDETRAGRREVTVLFADLKGFTTFSEAHEATEVNAMLNTYFQVAVPAVVSRHGGYLDRIIGDALMVTFNTRGDQPDHAVLGARAALDLQRETARIADQHPDWPRFRVGVHTGEASPSLLGAEGGRTWTVIGDVVNVASRIEGRAPVGGVAVSAGTLGRLPGASVQPLGALELKGKETLVDAFVLQSLP